MVTANQVLGLAIEFKFHFFIGALKTLSTTQYHKSIKKTARFVAQATEVARLNAQNLSIKWRPSHPAFSQPISIDLPFNLAYRAFSILHSLGILKYWYF